MLRLFRSKAVPPPRVGTDRIIPLHRLDDTFQNRLYTGRFLMRFNDVLDPEKLRSGLERLLQRDGWRKLGGRLRLNAKGKLEYHIPSTYTVDRPAIRYSRVRHDMPIGRHALASKVPSGAPTLRPAVVADPTEFFPLTGGPEYPRQLDDYLSHDEPQIGLHITSFSDATLVSLCDSHTLYDVGGRKELLDAWSLTIRGREDEVRPLHGYDQDPLAALGDGATEPYKLEDRLMTGWRGHLTAARFLLQKLYAGEETRVICIPAPHVASLRRQAAREWSGFLSEGDVLGAWVARLVCATAPLVSAFPRRTVRLGNAYGLRPVLGRDEHDLLPAGRAYAGNAADVVYAFFPARDMAAGRPLARVAAGVRRSIRELGSREQVEAAYAAHRRTGGMAWAGDLSMYMIWLSNLTRADLYQVDFSAAVVSRGLSVVTRPRETKPGRPSYVQTIPTIERFPRRNQLVIYGKGAGGDYWLAGCLKKGAWAKIDKALEREWDASQNSKTVDRSSGQ